MNGTLETIIREIVAHDRDYPTHGVGCACMDAHSGKIRRLFDEEGLYVKKTGTEEDGTTFTVTTYSKSMRNLFCVFGYVSNNP